VADTLDNYSLPNQQKLLDAATAKRTADYTAPINGMTFAAPTGPLSVNSAVNQRNAATADTAKKLSLGEAIAKAGLDAYGDTNQNVNIVASNNANKIAATSRIMNDSANAENQQQATLQTKLAADQHAGDAIGGIGKLVATGGMLNGTGALTGLGNSLFGGTVAAGGNGAIANLGQFGTISGATPAFSYGGVF
jgi:hypothetical protein